MRQREPTFGHHLDEVSKAELVAQIPAHTEDYNFTVEMAAFEEFVHVRQAPSALSFDQFAGYYAEFTQLAPEPLAAHATVGVTRGLGFGRNP